MDRILVSVDLLLLDETVNTFQAIDDLVEREERANPGVKVSGRCHRGGGNQRLVFVGDACVSREVVEGVEY